MPFPDYRIRTMSRDEVRTAIDWAAQEGWNPGLHDAECFHAADPHGFLVGELGDEPIATISAVKYGRSFGFIGLYIVKPGFRGKGHGIQVWNAAIHYLSGRNIGLDGVVSQQENYRKSGFRLSHRNTRFEGVSSVHAGEAAGVVGLSQVDFEIVAVVVKYELNTAFPIYHECTCCIRE